MALNTQHYIELGADCAKKGLKKPSTMKTGSWQFQAFMAGYKTELGIQSGLTPLEASTAALSGRIVSDAPNLSSAVPKGSSLRPSGKPQPLPEGHPAHKYFEGWPPAAVEHVRSLALQIADESNPVRQKRLMNSFGRVYRRHQGNGRSMLGVQSALGMLPT